MNKTSEDELKKITETNGFEYVGVEWTGKTYIKYICKKHPDKGVQKRLLGDMRKSNEKCPYCTGRKRDHEDFVKLMENINPNIMFLSNYTKCTDKIKCKCLICSNEWSAKPNCLLNGKGCKICANKKLSVLHTKADEEFKREIKNIFGDNIKIISKYKGSHEDIICKCTKHNVERHTTPTTLLNCKVGCPTCRGDKVRERCVKDNNTFLRELELANPNIIPLEPYKTNSEKIKCYCKIHNYTWMVSPNKILFRHTGCPKCNMYHNESIIYNILSSWGYNCTPQKKYDDCRDIYPLPFDCYIEHFNILIEYDGEGHYYPIKYKDMNEEQAIKRWEKTVKHDEIKTKYCKKNNIPLIRIPYWENKNIEYYLFEALVKYNAIEEINIS